ncbi:hypothetical protein [Pedobacter frigidisoli]|uniref:hypothetical protein n=1 Tax=Pedobacter frigidisoli TaxID=2530455 RepID=UPI00292ECA84|nr:hypothetical protein [Pedobacter frigidisoli]
MKQFTYLLALVLFCSCKGEKKETSQSLIATPGGLQGLQQVSNPTPQTATTKSNLIFNPPHGQPGHTCALAVGAPLNQSAPAQAQVSTKATPPPVVPATVDAKGKKLNPKHGEPGHRCDIAVGAPLDSKPVQVAQATTPQPVVTQVSTVKVAKGMNPPHGQPNHRCDIAVGAPLTSKPVAVKTTAVSQTPAPPAAEAGSLEAKTGVKLNPKHGEPGHRCDIAVGAPLS